MVFPRIFNSGGMKDQTDVDTLEDEFVKEAIEDAKRIQPGEPAIDARLVLVDSWKNQLTESLKRLEADEEMLQEAKLDIEAKLLQNQAVVDSVRAALRTLDEYKRAPTASRDDGMSYGQTAADTH